LVVIDVGEYRNVLPLIVCKFIGKKTAVFHLGANKFIEARLEFNSGFERVFPSILMLLLRLCYGLVDRILCISPSIVKSGELERYNDKITVFGGPYVKTEPFVIEHWPTERDHLVAYAGRLSAVKGDKPRQGGSTCSRWFHMRVCRSSLTR
jgi:hypothetical protein